MSLLDKPVRGWSHIILEGFCTRHLSEEKDKYVHEIVSIEPFKTIKKKNPKYDPKYRTPRKPKYCINAVCNICWEKECPYLGLSIPDEEDYENIMSKIAELYKDD